MMLKALEPTQETANIVATLRGRWHGSYAMCPCPAHRDRKPSLSVRQGDHGILVHCFAGCTPGAVMRALRNLDPVSAASVPDYRPPGHNSPGHNSNAARLWNEGLPVKGTLAERYLIRRNLPSAPCDVRYHASCPHGRKPDTVFVPALLVAVRLRGTLVAVQRIFLDPDTAKYTVKKLLGSSRDAAWEGTVPGDKLAIAESFEDAHAYTALCGIPCWSSMGTGKLHLLNIPASVKTIILAPDDDNPGRVAGRRGADAYKDQGFTVRKASPAPYKDWTAMIEARAGQVDRKGEGEGRCRSKSASGAQNDGLIRPRDPATR